MKQLMKEPEKTVKKLLKGPQLSFSCRRCHAQIRGYVYQLQLTKEGIEAIPACPECGYPIS